MEYFWICPGMREGSFQQICTKAHPPCITMASRMCQEASPTIISFFIVFSIALFFIRPIRCRLPPKKLKCTLNKVTQVIMEYVGISMEHVGQWMEYVGISMEYVRLSMEYIGICQNINGICWNINGIYWNMLEYRWKIMEFIGISMEYVGKSM